MREALGLAGAVLSGLHGHDDGPQQGARLDALVVKDTPFGVEMTAPLNVGVDNLYAGHRSHSSHSSHASHYSGSGGYRSAPYVPPSPYVAPSPAPRVAPSTYPSLAPSSTRSAAPVDSLAPSSTRPVETPAGSITGGSRPDALQVLIMRVQVSLYAAGYDPGAVDGVMSEPTRAALKQYQVAKGLKADGRMSTETLNALGVGIPK
ncbi:His-Xaa-Ser repeat protein HxsA [Cognatilysobacter terrigena]|uniref:His-Xaa-Ser repeat protein HxsA n=1 Tax=Cognatilysobacter terrigena TaxID=2488749 RepID=UPI00105EFEDF|nr:His-Xaa-Ser repeat protein HxsA [Lysobacter terrigena]